MRWSRGALCECAARERCGRRLKPLFADLDGESAGDVRGKGAMCDRLEGRRFEEADDERSEKGKGAVRGDAFYCAYCRAVRFRGVGVCTAAHFRCAQEWRRGVMRAVWRWALIRARFAIARRMNSGAAEATKLGGKGLTAPLARRENDAGGG